MTTATTTTRTSTADRAELLSAVRDLVPAITARSEEIERARRIPPDLVAQLTAAGCFRALVPLGHGGAELDLATHMDVIRTLAQADGSVGWTVMIGSAAPVILGLLPPQTFAEIYADRPDIVLAGAFNPTGLATPVDGGFRVNGRWSFASGCQHADWFIAHCFVDDGREPPIRMMVLPPDEVAIEDTWSVAGLCGTGSHDFTVSDAFVATARSFVVFGGSNLDGALYRIPELSLSSMLIASVAVGIATGALESVTTLATGKTPMFADATLAANPLFQHQLGEADAALRAATAALTAVADEAWATAAAAAPFTPRDLARIRGTAVWATRTAATVVDAAYTAGGGSAMYSSSPLQRRLRDVHAVTQHFAVKPDTLTTVGAVLVGHDVDLTFL